MKKKRKRVILQRQVMLSEFETMKETGRVQRYDLALQEIREGGEHD